MLHDNGLDARVLAGGIGGFRRSGRTLEPSATPRP
jgi:hypothetical protein